MPVSNLLSSLVTWLRAASVAPGRQANAAARRALEPNAPFPPAAKPGPQSRYGLLWPCCKRSIAGLALMATLSSPVLAETLQIAALGDSLTQGYGLPQGDGLVPQLQHWLQARGADALLINAGVSGDTTAGGLSRIDWTLGPEVGALIVNLGGNDLLRGGDPALARANLDGILTRARERGLPVLLVGVSAPGNYGTDYKAQWDGLFPDLAETHGALLLEDFLAPLTADTQSALGRYMQPDGVHPNAEGVALLIERLGPKVLELIAQAEVRRD